MHDPIGLGKVKKPFGRYNRFLNQDCWPNITHLVIIDKDPSSLMDDLALEATFGGVMSNDCTFPLGWGQVKNPKVPSKAKSSIRLDGSLSVMIR